MFTGLVETIGRVRSLERAGEDGCLEVVAHFDDGGADIGLGHSLAVDGACLTVVRVLPEGTDLRLRFEASHETFERTTLGRLGAGSPVHLERALRLGDRLGGHLVTGHVDAVGRIERVVPHGRAWDLEIAHPEALGAEIVTKGSIAVHGVSLTVNRVAAGRFGVTIVPHTNAHTTLAGSRPGRPVNLETDLLGKYVVHVLGARGLASPRQGLSIDALKESGFL